METQVGRRSAAAGRAAVGLVVVALTIAAVTIVLDVRTASVSVPASTDLEAGWVAALSGLAQLVPGVLLLYRLPRHPVAWLLTGSGLVWLVDGLAGSWATYAVYLDPGLPGAAPAYWFYQRFGATLLLGLPLLILLFPDGRLPTSRWWRRVSILSLGLTALLPLLLLVVPSAVMMRYHQAPLPPEITRLGLDPVSIDLPYATWRPILQVAYAAVLVSLVVPFAVAVHRFRSADGDRRAQLKWLMWAACVDMFVFLLLVPMELPSPLPSVLVGVAIALTSAAVVVAVTKHRLYDIDRLLSATFLYAVLALIVVLVDVAVFTVAGSVLGERASALFAIGLVAVVYGPLRTWLWVRVRRLVRGSRDDPYAAMSTLAERLELAGNVDEQLLTVARSLADAFRLPYVQVEIERPGGARAAVEYGRPTGPPVALPVAYRGEHVGRLILCPAGHAELSNRDQQLLGDLVRQAAAAARASEVSAALRDSRTALVVAREEERRRLRRDLHDGLGPSLGAVSLRIETARNLAGTSTEAADRMLQQAIVELATVLTDVRRLVHDLRPPALDELGLLRAVQQLAERFDAAAGLSVTVSGDESLDRMPAAVEVAAYRIASEALANVVRHSRAGTCVITLTVVDGALSVEVRDDGVGIGADVEAGVGMLSLRERATELGGGCEVTCPAVGGTAVRAWLPLDTSEEVAGV